MNRRQFLKALALAAIGLAIPVPPIVSTIIGPSVTTGTRSVTGVGFQPQQIIFFDSMELVSMDADGFTWRPSR